MLEALGLPARTVAFELVLDALVAASEGTRVFDLDAGAQVAEGKKSLAVNVVMRAPDRQLTPEEVLAVRAAVIAIA